MEKKEHSGEFDPSGTDEFQKNLSKAFESDSIGADPIRIVTDDSSSILTITEKTAGIGEEKEKTGESGGQASRLTELTGLAEENTAADETAVFVQTGEEEELPVIDISFAFEDEVPQEAEVDDAVLENISNQLASQVSHEYSETERETAKKKIPGWLIPVAISVSCLFLVFLFFFCTNPGRKMLLHTSFGKYLISHVGGMIFEDETVFEPALKLAEPLIITIAPTLTPEPEPTVTSAQEPEPEPTKEPEPEEDVQTVYHLLLLGMDEEEEEKPKADLILLVTLDTVRNEIKLTAVLRDLLVQIPGQTDDKISTVYSKGGISLMYDVLETALGVRPDGYLLFTYDGFKKVIDNLGGVSMTITAREADYLNKTNYIALPENRNLTAGMNHLNGDQALGYCRIRHVGTAQNEYNDIGRTARCRRLITAVFEQYRNKGAVELYQAAKQCLSYLVTDITGEECTEYLELLLNMNGIRISDYRIPSDGTYQTSIIRGSSTLVADMNQNRTLWQEFLFPADPQEHEEETKE